MDKTSAESKELIINLSSFYTLHFNHKYFKAGSFSLKSLSYSLHLTSFYTLLVGLEVAGLGQDVNEEGAVAETLKQERFEDFLGGEDGVAFAEIVEICGDERDAAAGVDGVIRSGVGEEGVALGD
ncbi:hypothetical protein Rs2_42556 [Raphanus sativus]|nr:hypothetical protein Rs2_42556 [Raphanus sativus]